MAGTSIQPSTSPDFVSSITSLINLSMADEYMLHFKGRTLEVLKLKRAGVRNKEIARQYNVSMATVSRHINIIHAKLTALKKKYGR